MRHLDGDHGRERRAGRTSSARSTTSSRPASGRTCASTAPTRDDWPELYERVQAADILVLGSPIWLGEKSSVCTRVIERLYACSSQLNEHGQYAYYGKVGGCLITGNEDGIKHCSMNILYSLQHLGYTIPPQADAGWIGEAGPGPSYLDRGLGRAGERLHEPEHDLPDLEPPPPRAHAEGRGRDPGPRQPALALGRRLPVRLPQSRVPVAPCFSTTPRSRATATRCGSCSPTSGSSTRPSMSASSTARTGRSCSASSTRASRADARPRRRAPARRVERDPLVLRRRHAVRARRRVRARAGAAVDVLRAVQPRAVHRRRRASGSRTRGRPSASPTRSRPG